jgi:MtN3 and saliva related transmembrane protein
MLPDGEWGSMNGVEFIGYVAAFLTTAAFIPQVVRAWRTHSTHDISLVMFVMLNLGIFLWLVYGVLIQDPPLIAANLVTGVLAASILYLKIRYK